MAQPRFKNWGCPSFLPVPTNVQLQRSNASEGVPLPSRLGSLGSFVTPVAGSWVESQSQTILGRFMYNFMRFHASFSAFSTSSCLEMEDSYIPLLAGRSVVPL